MGTGSRDTEVKQNLSKYLEQLHLSSDSYGAQAEQYVGFVSALDSLNELTERLYTRDEAGRYPPFRKEDQEQLLSGYNQAIIALGKLRQDLGADEKFRELRELTDGVQQLLAGDVSALTGVLADGSRSLAETIDAGRTTRIDVSGKTLSTIGADSNTRQAVSLVQDGKVRKGFFTEERTVRVGEEDCRHTQALAAVFQRQYPDYARLVDPAVDLMFRNNGFTMPESIFQFMVTAAEQNPELLAGKSMEDLRAFAESKRSRSLYDTDNLPPVGTAEYRDYQDLKKYQDFLRTLPGKMLQYGATINASPESGIAGRNVAMSKAANLFGVSQLVANSEKMELADENGTVIRGVFMDSAVGTDPRNITPETMQNCPPNPGDNAGLLKDLSDLQVLDYICGNIDRHGKNLFYRFNADQTQIVGIQGIDNDYSFGTTVLGDDEALGLTDTPLEDISVISQSMGRRLLATDESMLRFSLRDSGLSEQEMNAAADRMARVKQNIRENKIQLVSDEKWNEFSLSGLASGAKKQNLFKTVDRTIRTMRTAQPEMEAEESAPLRFERGTVLDGINHTSLRKDAQKATEFADRMAASQRRIWGKGSEEFRDLTDAVREYQTLTAGLGENSPYPDFVKAQAMLEGLSAQAQTYLDTKAGKKLNRNGEARQKLAQEIKAFADRRLPEFRDALHHKDEMAVEEDNVRMKLDAAKAQEASFESLCVHFDQSIPDDESRLAEYGNEVVKLSYFELGSLAEKRCLSGAETADARKYLTDLVAFDLMMSERGYLKNEGKTGPGPLEQKYTEESLRNHGYKTSLHQSIRDNPVFREMTKNLNPTAIRRFVTSGVHKISLEIAKDARQRQANPNRAAKNEPNRRQEQPSANQLGGRK